MSLYDMFAASEHGKGLASQVRYARYKPEGITSNYWLQILGPDVCNLMHMLVMLGITKEFVVSCGGDSRNGYVRFTRKEQHILQLVAVTHDFGEAVIGDITADKKTLANEHEEMQHLERILLELSASDNGLISRDEISQILNVLSDKTSKLGHAFNIIERLGYLATAIQAWNSSLKVEMYGEGLCVNFKWLVSNVLGNQICKILDASWLYPMAQTFLDRHFGLISQAFDEMPEMIFDLYSDQEDRILNSAKFRASKEAWDLFCKNYSP
ncbi:MAG: hypothetical protein HGA61_04320 [Candidatus Moranbacteria bacterium]|nr:hypothetical protein [Candidatus Moranbacteria bacterium]